MIARRIRSSVRRRVAIAALLASAAALGPGPTPLGAAFAQPEVAWRVRGKLLGEPRSPDVLDSKKASDVSGIACAADSGFPRVCVVADDEAQGVQVAVLRDGEITAGSFIPLISDSHDGKLLELDAEGVAFADGAFYVVGSHGRPRHDDTAADRARSDARAAASRRIFRIRIAPGAVDMATGRLTGPPDITRSLVVSSLVQADARLARWFDRPLAENGLTVEGLAVRDGRLHVGLRGPVLDGGDAAMLAVPLGVVFDGQAAAAAVEGFGLGRDSLGHARGIRDLLAYRGRLLILAGPVQDPPKGHDIRTGDYSIYAYQEGGDPKLLLDLPGFGAEVKPEAMLPLAEADGALRVLLFFDGPDEGAPRSVRLRLD